MEWNYLREILLNRQRDRERTYRDPVVECAFTCATSLPWWLSLLPSHPAAMMMTTQNIRPAAIKLRRVELARGSFSGFVMVTRHRGRPRQLRNKRSSLAPSSNNKVCHRAAANLNEYSGWGVK